MSITHIAFYPSDWLAGTRGMTAEESGVYITIICRMYEMAGPIERNDDRLFRICGCKSKRHFAKIVEYLISEGKLEERDGELFNERTQKEIKKVVEKSSQAKDAANSRWERKSNKTNGRGDAGAMRADMRGACQPEPEPYNTLPIGSDEKSSSNIRDQLWDRGLRFLVSKGVKERQARSLIGKWLKVNDPQAIFDAFKSASDAGTKDPIPYITEALKPPADISEMINSAVRKISDAAE